jgi:putative transcriptional regulator
MRSESGDGVGWRLPHMASGLSGWGPGQLEAEIARNDWLTCEAAEGLLFAPDDGGKWSAALRGMGMIP